MRVHILPSEWEFGELVFLWNRWEKRDALIPWDVAIDYFRKNK